MSSTRKRNPKQQEVPIQGLPEKGKRLLRVLEPVTHPAFGKLTSLEALEALQRHLGLDEKKAAQWMATVCDSRR
jgi:hypothetical protein